MELPEDAVNYMEVNIHSWYAKAVCPTCRVERYVNHIENCCNGCGTCFSIKPTYRLVAAFSQVAERAEDD